MRLPGKRQKAAVNGLADAYAAQCFQYPLPGCRAAVPFGQSPKRHQKRFCSPAPSENTCGIFRRRRISGMGSLVLLMQAGCGKAAFYADTDGGCAPAG